VPSLPKIPVAPNIISKIISPGSATEDAVFCVDAVGPIASLGLGALADGNYGGPRLGR